MVPDKYPAYIDRETYDRIQAILRDNYQEYHRRRSRGVARSGAALLQGLAYCGHCGSKMTVQYHAAPGTPATPTMQSGGTECQRLPIAPVDSCVVQDFLGRLVPRGPAAMTRPSRDSTSRIARSSEPAISSWNVCASVPARREAIPARRPGEPAGGCRAGAALGTGTAGPSPGGRSRMPSRSPARAITAETRRQWDEARPTLRNCGMEGT